MLAHMVKVAAILQLLAVVDQFMNTVAMLVLVAMLVVVVLETQEMLVAVVRMVIQEVLAQLAAEVLGQLLDNQVLVVNQETQVQTAM